MLVIGWCEFLGEAIKALRNGIRFTIFWTIGCLAMVLCAITTVVVLQPKELRGVIEDRDKVFVGLLIVFFTSLSTVPLKDIQAKRGQIALTLFAQKAYKDWKNSIITPSPAGSAMSPRESVARRELEKVCAKIASKVMGL